MANNWDAVIGAIRAERGRLRWSQEDLASRAGVSLGTIKNLEGQHAYKRTPVEPLRAVDAAFGWEQGTLERKLAFGQEPSDRRASEFEPGRQEGEWVRRKPSASDLVVALDHIVMDIVAYVAPNTTAAEIRELQERTRRTAEELGFDTRRRRLSTHTDDDPEN